MVTEKRIEDKNTVKKIITKSEDGVTVAIIEGYMDPAYEVNMEGKPVYTALIKLLDSYRHMPEGALPVMKGVAHCSKEEEFNDMIGEDLACSRADAAYHHRMAQIYKQNIDELKRAIARFEELEGRHRKKESGLRKHIANIVSEESVVSE